MYSSLQAWPQGQFSLPESQSLTFSVKYPLNASSIQPRFLYSVLDLPFETTCIRSTLQADMI
jgi:hypothetical protein